MKAKSLSTFEAHPVVLLTGAGFTHNFNGFLATQMWEHIFNCVGVFKSARVQALMKGKLHKFDYEKLYAKLRAEGGNDFTIYRKAIEKVYGDLDDIVAKSLDQNYHHVSLVGIRRWLARRFSGLNERPSRKGFIFSLNQDLFFERHARDEFSFWIPGVPNDAQAGPVQQLSQIGPIQLDKNTDTEAVRKSLQDLNLIKLHGSCNWVSSNGEGVMVLGEGKAETILKEPLLDFYLKLFEEVMYRQNLQLWVIGYGFGDTHINSIIARSIKKFGLRLCVIDHCRPNSFFERLRKAPKGNDLVKGVSALITNSLEGILPTNRWTESKPLGEIQSLMNTVDITWRGL